MIELEILKGQNSGQVFKLNQAFITIGRLDSNQVVLPDYHISNEHAQIFWEDESYIFRDLRSTNGSVLKRNNEEIPLDGADRWEISLQEGDLLLLGAPYSPVVLRCNKLVSFEESGESANTTHIISAKSLSELEQLKSKMERDRELTSVMYNMVQTIGRSGLKLENVLRNVALSVFSLLDRATNVAVYLKNPINGRMKETYSCSRDGQTNTGGSSSVISLVFKKKAAILAADAASEISDSASVMSADIRSVMAVPFWSGNEISGVLQCDNRGASGAFRPQNRFDEQDLEYLTLLSYQAALAIDNARLYKQLEDKKEQFRTENTYLKKQTPKYNFSNIIAESAPMKKIFAQLEKVIDTRVSIHVHGETGTGKELIASAIHYQSRRRNKMFVAQNCAALPDTLLESELFGHVKGAFTGADRNKKGLFEIADGGTLFLDEIADMPANLQVKLLRVLQEGEIRPLGSVEVKYVDVRIISATHKKLEDEVSAGRFREDLYYRLHVFPVNLPPLRERRDDIPLLTKFFLEKYNKTFQKNVKISDEVLSVFMDYTWKGNIRELENEVQKLVLLADDGSEITLSDLSPARMSETASLASKVFNPNKTLKEMMEEVEIDILKRVLKSTGGNKTKAAAKLGITREGLHKKLAKYKF